MSQKKVFLGKVVGILPARWNSSRFPGKPLAKISGKTVISRAYQQACKAKLLDHVSVATDDSRIYNHIIDLGGNAIMTSSHCSNGTERIAEVVVNHYPEAEIIVNIQGDEPFINPKILDNLVKKMQLTPEADLVTPIYKQKATSREFSQKTVKCVISLDGKALYFSRSPIPAFYSKLSEQEFYIHMGLYCFRRELLLEYSRLQPGKLAAIEDLEQLKILENGKKIYTIFANEKSICIDYPEDIKMAEDYLLCNSHVYS